MIFNFLLSGFQKKARIFKSWNTLNIFLIINFFKKNYLIQFFVKIYKLHKNKKF